MRILMFLFSLSFGAKLGINILNGSFLLEGSPPASVRDEFLFCFFLFCESGRVQKTPAKDSTKFGVLYVQFVQCRY